MSIKEKLVNEFKALGLITFYFGLWVGIILILKKLLLAQYGIPFSALMLALVGTLLLAKVILLMEHIRVETWIRNQPLVVPVILRTIIYTLGVLVVLMLERAFETRHKYGSFSRALIGICQHADYPRVLFNTICLSLAILNFNVLSVLRQRLGKDGLRRLFFTRPDRQSGQNRPK